MLAVLKTKRHVQKERKLWVLCQNSHNQTIQMSPFAFCMLAMPFDEKRRYQKYNDRSTICVGTFTHVPKNKSRGKWLCEWYICPIFSDARIETMPNMNFKLRRLLFPPSESSKCCSNNYDTISKKQPYLRVSNNRF